MSEHHITTWDEFFDNRVRSRFSPRTTVEDLKTSCPHLGHRHLRQPVKRIAGKIAVLFLELDAVHRSLDWPAAAGSEHLGVSLAPLFRDGWLTMTGASLSHHWWNTTFQVTTPNHIQPFIPLTNNTKRDFIKEESIRLEPLTSLSDIFAILKYE